MEFNGDRVTDRGMDRGMDHGTDACVVEGLGFDPFTDSPSVILDQVCDVEPGLFVASILEMLDPSSLNARDAVRYLEVHERVASWWASRQSVALVAAAGRVPSTQEFVLLDRLSQTERVVRIAELARDDIAAALRWGPMSTQSRIDQARLLAGPLTATHQALSLGEITPMHVRILTEAAQRLSSWSELERAIHNHRLTHSLENQLAEVLAQAAFDADCIAVQERVLPTARCQGFTRTKTKANRCIDSIDARGQARRKAAARRRREVYVTPDVDGLSTLIARLDTFTANAIMGAINAAITHPGIPGACDANIGVRRSEALAALIFGAPNSESGCPTPIAVNITVDLIVPITELDSKLGSRLNVDSTGCDFSQLLTDPCVKVFARPAAVSDSGHVLDVGRRRYQITGALRAMITLRDGSCRFPGCNAAASRCQIDHVIPWDQGGGSDVGNLGVLCVRHHQLKTHGGWKLTDSKPNGSCTWRSPQGLTYHHYPEPITEPKPADPLNTTDPPDIPTF